MNKFGRLELKINNMIKEAKIQKRISDNVFENELALLLQFKEFVRQLEEEK